MFVPAPINDRLWHLPFNRLHGINEQLVAGREDVFYRWEFDAAAKTLLDEVIDYSLSILSNPESLHASFEWYRAAASDRARGGRGYAAPCSPSQ